jgi:hypothetical protein
LGTYSKENSLKFKQDTHNCLNAVAFLFKHQKTLFFFTLLPMKKTIDVINNEKKTELKAVEVSIPFHFFYVLLLGLIGHTYLVFFFEKQ